MCRLSWNLGASTYWNPQGLSRTVMGLLYLYLYLYLFYLVCVLEQKFVGRQSLAPYVVIRVTTPSFVRHTSVCFGCMFFLQCRWPRTRSRLVIKNGLPNLKPFCLIRAFKFFFFSEFLLWFLSAFAKLRQATISFAMSLCPSVRTENLRTHCKDYR